MRECEPSGRFLSLADVRTSNIVFLGDHLTNNTRTTAERTPRTPRAEPRPRAGPGRERGGSGPSIREEPRRVAGGDPGGTETSRARRSDRRHRHPGGACTGAVTEISPGRDRGLGPRGGAARGREASVRVCAVGLLRG
ncbi:predicted protein [Streptomyces sp. SPB78]|nr:predicted protein [Streptomyces sp. SPB78]